MKRKPGDFAQSRGSTLWLAFCTAGCRIPETVVPGLELDGNHVKVNLSMETNIPGLFACGDITGTPYQYIKAAGQGNVAALSAVAYLDAKKREAGKQ